MEKLKFGVIGCGGRGADVAGLMLQTEGAQLVSVCDVDEEKARQVGERLKVPAFTRGDEMLAQMELDALFIATPVEHHLAVARTAILQGKHVVVEKMMTTSAAEAWELVRLAEMRGVCGAISYQLRFYPVFQKWWELAQKMQPLLIIASRNPGIMPPAYLRPELWAGIMDFLTHDLDLVLWVSGQEPETVFAVAYQGAVTDTDAFDTLSVTLQFSEASGLVYGGMSGWGIPSIHAVIGRKGNVRIAGNNVEVNRIDRNTEGRYERIPDTVEAESVHTDTTDRLLNHFSAWVQGKREAFPLATFEDGLKVMLVHEAIWESLKTGQPVALTAVKERSKFKF